MGLLELFFDLIFKPGSSLKLVPVINAAVIALLLVLGSLCWNTIPKVHLWVMGFLALNDNQMMQDLAFIQNSVGAVPGPTAWGRLSTTC